MAVANTKKSFLATLQAYDGGIAKYLADQSLLISKVSTKCADIRTKLQGWEARQIAVDGAYAEWKRLREALVADKKATIVPYLRLLRRAIEAVYGPDDATLLEFGLTPRRVPVRTTESRLAAAKKAVATRLARHTLGPKARKAIKGTVPEATTTPPSEPTPPASNPGGAPTK